MTIRCDECGSDHFDPIDKNLYCHECGTKYEPEPKYEVEEEQEQDYFFQNFE